jgi:flagellar hook-associated protein 1 FlgK
VDNVLANPDTGLSSALQSFFNAVHEVAANPASLATRQVLLTEAEARAQRYHAMDKQLNDLEQEVNVRLTGAVSEVNALTQGIADLNRQIVEAEGASGGQPANDLRDRRDELLRQLAGQIGFHTIEQDDGTLNVLIGNGHPVVVGDSALTLGVIANPFEPTRKEIALATGDSRMNISSTLSGGAIGGALDFRDHVLAEAKNALGRVAVGLAENFNRLHRSGADLDGNPGLDFFVPVNSIGAELLGHEHNTGPQPTVTVTDPAALTTSDYRLEYDGTEYVVTRLSDNQEHRFSAAGASSITIDGFEIDVSMSPAAGDSFIVRPVGAGAGEFGLAIHEPQKMAAAEATGGVGDNRNALALAALQESPTLDSGRTTLAGAYGQLVASIGAATQKADVRRSAQEVLLNQVTDARDAVSGVNLDEEAANLLRYQQAYEASAKVVAAADTTFKYLLDVIGG